MIKHLMFYWYIPDFFWHEIYDLHLRKLSQYYHVFDKMTFVLSIDDTENIELIEKTKDKINAALQNVDIEYVIYQNDKQHQESAYVYNEIVMKFDSFDNELLFFAHAKGVNTNYVQPAILVDWIEFMYDENLNKQNIYKFENDGEKYCMGTLKQYKNTSNIPNLHFQLSDWHFPGTFYWLRPNKIYEYINENNIVLSQQEDRYFSEIFLGIIFRSSSKHILELGPQIEPFGDMNFFQHQFYLLKHFTHVDIINHLIKKYSYKSYLEIGVDGGECFKNVVCDTKYCVDPYFLNNNDLLKSEEQIPMFLTWRMTSDELFKQTNQKFDIIFVDGMHTEENAGRDIINGLKHLNPGGKIVVHDCIPSSKQAQMVPRVSTEWNGDVWKAITMLHTQNIQFKTVNIDCGCGIIDYIENPEYLTYLKKSDLSYEDFVADRDNLINVIEPIEFWQLYEG